jgi:transcription elongation factor GreA
MVEQKVVLGATVAVMAENTGQKMTFMLVRAEEANVNAGLLSAQSPLGSALIGSQVGDRVTVEAPAGLQEYTVLKIGDG